MIYVSEGTNAYSMHLSKLPEGWITRVSDPICHCWSVWEGSASPRTPLEKLIRLAGVLGVKFYYSFVDPIPADAIPLDLESLRLFIFERWMVR